MASAIALHAVLAAIVQGLTEFFLPENNAGGDTHDRSLKHELLLDCRSPSGGPTPVVVVGIEIGCAGCRLWRISSHLSNGRTSREAKSYHPNCARPRVALKRGNRRFSGLLSSSGGRTRPSQPKKGAELTMNGRRIVADARTTVPCYARWWRRGVPAGRARLTEFYFRLN